MTQDADKDFFISYNKVDRAWAEWIAWQLEAEGYTTVVQAWDFRPGSNFILEMQKAASLAMRTLALLSLPYLDSLYAQPEWVAAFVQDPTGEKGTLLPVKVRPCELKGFLTAIIYINLVDLNELEACQTLLDGIRRTRAKPSTAPMFPGKMQQQSVQLPRFPGTLPDIWNVPFRRNPFFTGRGTLLAHLHDQLNSIGAAALTQAQAISGLGGIGKTQTAVEYAFRYQEDYNTVLWAGAFTRTDLLTGFVKIAALLALPERNAQDQDITVAAVKHWLETHTGWLLILDNADDVKMVYNFLPMDGKGHILLTTRAQATGTIANAIEVEKMDQQEGTLLLLRRARVLIPGASLRSVPEAELGKAQAIVQALDGLPLALDQAGAYIEETSCTLSDYLQLYQAYRKELLALRKTLSADHPEPVATTWLLSFQKIEKANRDAAALLRLIAFLAPDSIPEEILTEGAPHLGNVLGPVAADPLKLNAAIEEVRRYSLIKRQAEKKTLSIHRLVQTVLKDGMTPKAQRLWAERAVRAVNSAFPSVEYETWSRCQRCLSHAQNCVDLIKQWDFVFSDAARLLNQTGEYLYERAQYDDAELLYQFALTIRDRVAGGGIAASRPPKNRT